MKINERISTKADTNLNSKLLLLTSDHRGITLVALIITVIIMLILVGVTINISLNGGLFDATKKAVKETEIAAYKEKIDAARINILAEQISKGLTSKEYMDKLEEELRKDKNFEDSVITRQDELTIILVTKEGYVFEINEQETNNTGKNENPEEPEIQDLNKGNTEFKYNPEGWTNGNVEVGIKVKEEIKGTLEYSTDDKIWKKYEKEIEVKNNGVVIYARVINSSGKTGTVATGNVTNIDAEPPTINVALNSPSQTTSSINLSIGVTDSLSGLSEIEWYYKLSTASTYTKLTDTYTEKNGGNAGEITAVTKTKEITGLTSGTYNIYAIVYDVAGNKKQSDEIEVVTEGVPVAEGKVNFTYEPSTWTSGNVNVTITKTQAVSSYELEYSRDGNSWESYTSAVPMSANGKIYARLKDSVGNIGGVATGNVTNIDTEPPTINVALNSPSQIALGINLSIGVTDSLSGLSEIEWYYKLSTASTYTKLTDTYTAKNGANAGTTTAVTKTKQITGLTAGTYNCYAVVYDVAGNSTRTPAGTATVNVTVPNANWRNENTGNSYITMQEAFSASNSGDTLTLLRSYTDSSSPSLSKNLTINIQSYIITKTTKEISIASGGTLRLKGSGTITTSGNFDLIINRGTLDLAWSAMTSSGSVGYYYFTGTLEHTGSGLTKAAIWNQSGRNFK